MSFINVYLTISGAYGRATFWSRHVDASACPDYRTLSAQFTAAWSYAGFTSILATPANHCCGTVPRYWNRCENHSPWLFQCMIWQQCISWYFVNCKEVCLYIKSKAFVHWNNFLMIVVKCSILSRVTQWPIFHEVPYLQ